MPTPIALQGIRGTGDWGTDERPKDFREGILFLNPNGDTPLQGFLGKLKSESLTDPEFAWWEEELRPVQLKVQGAIANGTIQSITVVAGGIGDESTGAFSCAVGDLFMVQTSTGVVTGEYLEITAAPTTDTGITVARGAAGSTAAAIADGAILTCVGSVFAEGTGAPNATSQNPTKVKNFAQIFKTAYELTNTADNTEARTGPALQNDKKRQMFKHASKLELAYLFGRAYETIGPNNKPKRYTGGLFNFLANQTKTFGKNGVATGAAVWNEDNFLDWVAQCFNYTADGVGNERIVLCGNGALNALNKLAKNGSNTRINYDGIVSFYGMELQRWVLPQGVLYFKSHPLFNINPVYQYAMLGLNISGLKDRFLRKHTFKDNIQLPDSDTKKGQWIGETGLEVHFPKTHFIMLNCGGVLS